MSSEQLPDRPSRRQLKSLAKDLRKAVTARDAEALARVRSHHPRHTGSAAEEPIALSLQDAQLVVAREHGFDSWPRLTAAVSAAAPDTEAVGVDGPAAAADSAGVFADLVGDSAALQRARHLLGRGAQARVPVLLTGEGGTGKRHTARHLHRLGGGGAWAEVHCDARHDTLGEADLFGFEPGAFTGATVSTPGALEQAAGGVLLLVEVGQLSASAQLRLFEAIESGRFRRLGSGQDRPVEARLVCTTSLDLRQRVKAGAFREDLYFHLQVLRIDLPPLGERVEDIPALVRHFAAAAPGTTSPATFSEAALAQLAAHPWPGNVRELRHVVEAAVVSGGPAVDTEALRLEAPSAA